MGDRSWERNGKQQVVVEESLCQSDKKTDERAEGQPGKLGQSGLNWSRSIFDINKDAFLMNQK